jgi:nicotinate-nucleotide adenylyltransferase
MQREKKINVALFGGAFDPPHIGHIAFCEALVRSAEFDKVWVEISIDHPFGKQLTPLPHRQQMSHLSLSHLYDKLELRTDEAKLNGTGYTIDLIRYLLATYPEYKFTLALGSDNYAIRNKWKDFDIIEKLVAVRFFGRRGWGNANAELELPESFPEVSSTELREKLNSGILPETLVNKQVAEYILEQKLYKIC